MQTLLEQLREKEYIAWDSNKSRTYQLIAGNMPLRGVIQAGYVVEQPTDCHTYIDVSAAQYKIQDYVPANSHYESQSYRPECVHPQGALVGLQRSYIK